MPNFSENRGIPPNPNEIGRGGGLGPGQEFGTQPKIPDGGVSTPYIHGPRTRPPGRVVVPQATGDTPEGGSGIPKRADEILKYLKQAENNLPADAATAEKKVPRPPRIRNRESERKKTDNTDNTEHIEKAREEMLADLLGRESVGEPRSNDAQRRLEEARTQIAELTGSEVDDHTLAARAAVVLHREGRNVDELRADPGRLLQGVADMTPREREVWWRLGQETGKDIAASLGVGKSAISETRRRIAGALENAVGGKERATPGVKETAETATLRSQIEALMAKGADRRAIVQAIGGTTPKDRGLENKIDWVLRKIRADEARRKNE